MNLRLFVNIARLLLVCVAGIAILFSDARADLVVNFESFPLATENHYNGPGDFKYQETVDYWYGPDVQDVGTISVNGVQFSNRQGAFGTWSGFAISNETNTTTPGFNNSYSAWPGSGAGGSSNYAIAFGYHEVQTTSIITSEFIFDPTSVVQLNQLPSIYLPQNYQAQSVAITNTTYAALAMRDGDAPSNKFGGGSGNAQDFFKVSVYGIDASNHVLSTKIDYYLADYRSADNSQDYIVNSWEQLDLSPLSGAVSLHFNLSSSDVGDFGMNTPGYFAMDNLTLTAVPEPSTTVLGLCAALGLAYSRRKAARVKLTKN